MSNTWSQKLILKSKKKKKSQSQCYMVLLGLPSSFRGITQGGHILHSAPLCVSWKDPQLSKKSSLTLEFTKAMIISHDVLFALGLMHAYQLVFFPHLLLILLQTQASLRFSINIFCSYGLTASHSLLSTQPFVRSSSSMTDRSVIIMIASLHIDSAGLTQKYKGTLN